MVETTPTISAVHEAFAKRCAQLNIPVWLCDAAGGLIAAPSIPTNGLDTSVIAEHIAQRALAPTLDKFPIPLGPAGSLLLLEEKRGAMRTSITGALLPRSDSVNQLATTLRWSYDDIVRSLRDQQTVGQFNERLAQAYEENNLLFRLSHALNRVTQPVDLVQMICNELLKIFPFDWIGIRFREKNDEVRDLAGRLFLAGHAPCDPALLESETKALLQSVHGENWNRLLSPGKCGLATLVGSEVIAEPIRHDEQVLAMLMAGNKHGDDSAVSSFETQFIEAAAGFLGIFHENIARFVEQESQFLGTLRALTASIDAKDRYTRGHSERVAHLSSIMAKAMNLGSAVAEEYRIAGMVHDVGKIGVPEVILCKPGKPTEEEYARIRRHPEIGVDILSGIPKLARSLPAVLHHHERWDGHGYPHKLAGEKIPVLARVMALADAFDAMSSTRSYRPALPREQVLTEIHRCAGSQFDPQLAPIFVRLDFSGFDALVAKHCASERFAE